ncbi:hypothetical protein ARTHRO9AX_180569 [Arthrobacter sp. 9AX]|nr:hypothetical protein ARTHRO9AX_180569 [Arthrobacter sp. 9AX]
MDREEREGALEPLAGQFHGAGQATVGGIAVELVPEDVRQQRRGHLGVRFGEEGDALFDQLKLELGKVFDDAVVDHGEPAVVGQVRVRVPVRRPAVGGPAGVPDAGHRFRQRALLQFGEQVAQLPRLLAGLNQTLGHNSDPCGVVAPVLQAAQSFKNHVQRTVTSAVNRTAHVSYDSTHRLKTIGRGRQI